MQATRTARESLGGDALDRALSHENGGGESSESGGGIRGDIIQVRLFPEGIIRSWESFDANPDSTAVGAVSFRVKIEPAQDGNVDFELPFLCQYVTRSDW